VALKQAGDLGILVGPVTLKISNSARLQTSLNDIGSQGDALVDLAGDAPGCRELYEGDTGRAHRFRYGLLLFDAATVVYVVGTSFLPRQAWIERIDIAFGLVVLLDFLARLAISRNRSREFLHLSTWADIAALVSFLAPVIGEGVGFLRSTAPIRRSAMPSTRSISP
jgi:hypothetical protein